MGVHPAGCIGVCDSRGEKGPKSDLGIGTQSLLHWKPACLRGCAITVYEVAIQIIPLFPEAKIAEDEDSQVVIMTGVKKADLTVPDEPH